MIEFDHKNPDYTAIFRERQRRLLKLRANPKDIPLLKQYYRDHPAQFISDWGCTVDPKNVERGLPSVIPFILFPKQAEWVDEVIGHWKNQKPLLTEKTRQMGFSWLSMALACTLCMFNEGMSIGFGSRKEEYVDRIGDPKSLFQKARMFMQTLPKEFHGGWDSAHMRINFARTGATITGEAGDNIGRGNTTSIYFVDESAFLERAQLVEASLSQTTNCRIDISTPNGLANPFAEKRFSGKVDVFTFHWRDDPRKDDAWYAKQVAELDPVTVAQEIDIDYSASVEGVLIPSAWVQSAIDSHVKLSVQPTGERRGALDVADQGVDLNAYCGRHGILVEHIEAWSGKGDDIFGTVQKAFDISDAKNYQRFHYDADGLGAGVRGDARVINEQRLAQGRLQITADPFRGSGAVHDPEGEMVAKRKNKDFFGNMKAQAWWSLRMRFQKTYRAVSEGMEFKPDEIISLSSQMPGLKKLTMELSQPTFSVNGVGKVVVDKAPDGQRSPNYADSVMICFHPSRQALNIIDDNYL